LWLHKHPNIWKFIKKIKSEESSTYLKYFNINAGTFKRKERSNKDIKRDENLLKCKFELVTKKVDMMEYLNRVSNLIHDYSTKKSSTSSITNSATSSTLTSQASNQLSEESD
jgi:hypothetical protein